MPIRKLPMEVTQAALGRIPQSIEFKMPSASPVRDERASHSCTSRQVVGPRTSTSRLCFSTIVALVLLDEEGSLSVKLYLLTDHRAWLQGAVARVQGRKHGCCVASERSQELPPSKREDSSSRKESPRQDQPHRVGSPVKEKQREYLSKVGFERLHIEVERDYKFLCRRYSKLSMVPEFVKILILRKETEVLWLSTSKFCISFNRECDIASNFRCFSVAKHQFHKNILWWTISIAIAQLKTLAIKS
ncbi:hypothetical protein R1flu_026046 [Riccia fluitans]|uniref:Uncharacterized protein n=1 Tax=Riccia fluitans TaxID=41844 RepID=A0ABD1XFL5_9MARC